MHLLYGVLRIVVRVVSTKEQSWICFMRGGCCGCRLCSPRIPGNRNGLHIHRTDHRLFRPVGGADSLLRDPDGQGGQIMNWAYWLSGIATLGIFIYLLIALFKPELFS
jgi:hypothetical protein